MQYKTYEELKKNKMCHECKMKLLSIVEVKKEYKIIKYSYCCNTRREFHERHIRQDCQDCNRQRHYKKYLIEGLRLPCMNHIITDPFDKDSLNPPVCDHKCIISELTAKNELNSILKSATCTECNTVLIDGLNGIFRPISCINNCGRYFCDVCVIQNMLMANNTIPETYMCFNCGPKEKEEAIRLGQLKLS
ncbi:MAG: hypothetical protein KGZ34_04500 [Nitrosarchaeum sp.]|nr:hypothetical protein [Nitrosarchaeum sp.]